MKITKIILFLKKKKKEKIPLFTSLTKKLDKFLKTRKIKILKANKKASEYLPLFIRRTFKLN